MKTPEIYSNHRLREIVEEYVHSERDRGILVEKYCNKKTIFELAELFAISETTVKNVIYKHGYIFTIMEKDQPKND